MSKSYQELHEGRRYRIENPDGSVDHLTSKEYLARRGRFNRAHPLAEVPSPGAGARRLENPGGAPMARTPDELARPAGDPDPDAETA